LSSVINGGAPKQSNPPSVKLLRKKTLTEGKKQTTESFRITGPFGWRVDPITGKWALHQGVDIARKKAFPYWLLQRAEFERQSNKPI